MLADAGAPVLVTQSALLRAAAGADGAHVVVRLDADWPAIARQPATAPAVAPRSATPRLRHLHLGLNRNPKGRRRRRMVAFPIWRQPRSSASPSRPNPAFCSSHRRASMPRCPEIATALCVGRDADASASRNASGCSGRSHADAACHACDLPPVLLPTRRRRCRCKASDRCRRALFAGSGCARWSSGRRMINAYGPTETTVCATMSDALSGRQSSPDRPSDLEHAGLCFGRWFGACSCWCCGELYIAGSGLARGYCGPFGSDGGAVRCGPVWCCGEPDVPHRGPGALA